MFDHEKSLPPEISIVEGGVSTESWVDPRLVFQVRPDAAPGVMTLKLWNPDFSTRLMDNLVEIRSGDEVRLLKNIKMGQFVTIDVSVPSATDGQNTVALRVLKYLENSDPTQRYISMRLVSVGWSGPEQGQTA